LWQSFGRKTKKDYYPDFFKANNHRSVFDKFNDFSIKFPSDYKDRSKFPTRERFYDFSENEMFNFMNYLDLTKKNDKRLFEYTRIKDYYEERIKNLKKQF